MPRKNFLITLSVLIVSLTAIAGSIYYSFGSMDQRNRIAIDLFRNPDGSFNYSSLENSLNHNLMASAGFASVIEFVTKHNGACTNKGCRLPISGSFCIAENAIISLVGNGSSQTVKVKKHLDGC